MATYTSRERRALLMDDMARARCVREAAVMLVLARTGTEFNDLDVEAAWCDVAAVAAEYDATPDDVQAALEHHEPSLAIGAEV